jgi:hypothetical protein
MLYRMPVQPLNLERTMGLILDSRDVFEWRAYMRLLTAAQLQCTYDREWNAGRHAIAELAQAEAARRNITLRDEATA